MKVKYSLYNARRLCRNGIRRFLAFPFRVQFFAFNQPLWVGLSLVFVELSGFIIATFINMYAALVNLCLIVFFMICVGGKFSTRLSKYSLGLPTLDRRISGKRFMETLDVFFRTDRHWLFTYPDVEGLEYEADLLRKLNRFSSSCGLRFVASGRNHLAVAFHDARLSFYIPSFTLTERELQDTSMIPAQYRYLRRQIVRSSV